MSRAPDAPAGTQHAAFAHLANDGIVDHRDDLGPELRLGDVGVDVDEEIVFVLFRLLGGVGEDVARVGLDRDLVELTKLRGSFEHWRGFLGLVRDLTGDAGT